MNLFGSTKIRTTNDNMEQEVRRPVYDENCNDWNNEVRNS